MSGYRSPQLSNKILQKPCKQRISRSVFALSLYSVSHKFTLTLVANKGKNKGKKITQQDITTCGKIMDTMIQQMTEAQGITETLKSNNQMAWIRQINNIRNTAEEIIQAEIIYA